MTDSSISSHACDMRPVSGGGCAERNDGERLPTSHYPANVRDLEFNLFEVLDLEKVLATGEFGELDGTTVRDMQLIEAAISLGAREHNILTAALRAGSLSTDNSAGRCEPIRKLVAEMLDE
nr:acyl-CoA dehydrogenase N-terminal domain-containing protein [Mycobacterium sp. JS623]